MEDFPLMVVAPGKGVEGLYAPHPILCTCDECTSLHEARMDLFHAGLGPDPT